MEQSDHELMRRLRQGDPAALEPLVRRWERPIARLLVRLTDARPERLNGEVEDLAQEVFLRVLRHCGRYSERHAFSTWLYRIALNVSRDTARRRRKWWKLERRPRHVAPAEPPSDKLSRAEVEYHVRSALAALPAKLREPLVLKHFGDLTFEEISRVLRRPVSTIKSRVQAGLLRLRAELKRRGIDEQELTP